jgi:hypothetical protein
MIYLLITTSILDKFNLPNFDERRERYLLAISETLKILPLEIKPLIVENNGKRDTYLDNFYHHHRQHVKVFYTNNNKLDYTCKGVNEIIDIKEVIEKYGIEEDDIIIKLTGRYRALTMKFFKYVIENGNNFDIFLKFFNVYSQQFDGNDCVLGCFAIRAKYIQMFNPLSMLSTESAEIAFAKYARFCGGRLKEIEELGIECNFALNNKLLIV